MLKKLAFLTIFIGCVNICAFSQCVEAPSDPCVSVKQSTLDRMAKALNELEAARVAIAAFEKVGNATDVERAAYKNLSGIYESAITIFQKGVADRDKVIELQQKALEAMATLNDKLLQQLDKKPSAWKKFLSALKAVAYVLAGAALKGQL